MAEVHGPEAAIASLEGLDLDDYYLFRAVRADLLVRLGRKVEAADAYARAISLTTNAPERASLERGLARAAES